MNLKQKPLELTILLLLLIFALIFFGLRPLLKTSFKNAHLDVAIKKEELRQKQEKLKNLQSVKAKMDNLKNDLEMMRKSLPKEEDMPAILVQTEAMVSLSALSISAFTPSAAAKPAPETQEGVSQTVTQQTGVVSTQIGLSLAGAYPSFIAFLENVEKNQRPTSISSINLSGGAADRPLSINLNIVSYYQK